MESWPVPPALRSKRAGQIDAQLAALRERYAKRPPVTALLETWNQPLYTIGGQQLMSDSLSICGAVNIFSDVAQLSSAVQVEAVISRDPDLIIAAAPPGGGAAMAAGMAQISLLEGRALRQPARLSRPGAKPAGAECGGRHGQPVQPDRSGAAAPLSCVSRESY